MNSELIIIQSSFPNDFDSKEICSQLISSKKAICIHKTAPITSYYEWNGTLETTSEFLLHIKSFKDQFSSVESFILKHHPYDVPEIISFQINDVNQLYLKWATTQ